MVAGGPPSTAAEPEGIIGELDGPFGSAFANLSGDQVKGHSRVLTIMNTDIMVRPATLMVSKVTVDNSRYMNILMGTVQGAISNGVLDAARSGYTLVKHQGNPLIHIEGTLCCLPRDSAPPNGGVISPKEKTQRAWYYCFGLADPDRRETG